MRAFNLSNFRVIKRILSKAHDWNKNTALIIVGIIIGAVGVGLINPGHIVQKSLNLVGIDTNTEQPVLTDQTAQTNQIKSNESGDVTALNVNNSDKKDGTTANSSSKPSSTEPEPTGSHTVITPEDVQKLKDSGAPYLIQGTDWKVKINFQLPTSCGSNVNPCPAGTTATVNASAYNVHTGELLPITECNGTWNKPYVGGDAAPTTLPDTNHCVLSFKPSTSGMYRLGIELYLSKSVYTDTIYWGGWVWGTDSPTSDGYFIN